MRKTVSIAALAVAALALSACAGGGDTGGSDASGSGSTGAAFDSAGLVDSTPAGSSEVESMTWALPLGEPPSIDPVEVGSDSAFAVNGNLCENLLLLNPDYSITSNLATSAEWASDTEFVIDLRDDVTFWDGTPMTADDVAFSLQRNMDPESGSINVSAFANVTSIDVTGPQQVTVSFSEPDSQFRNTLAGPTGVVMEQAFTEQAGDDFGSANGGVMCTGPFAFDSWTPGEGITIVANDDYWKGAPLLKKIEFVFVADDATLTSGLLSGEIDGTFDVPVASTKSLAASDSGSLYIGNSTQYLTIFPTTSEGLAADPAVREALSLAIDKDALISTALGGYGAPQKTFIPPFAFSGMEAADIYQAGYDALPSNDMDIEAAKKLMEGVDTGDEPLVFAIQAGSQMWSQIGSVVQEAGKEIGLDIELRQLQGTDFANLFYDQPFRDSLDIDFVGLTGYLVVPGVLTYTSFMIAPDGIFNWTSYENEEVAGLYAQAAASTDPETSAQAFVDAQAIFAPENLAITLSSQYARSYLSDDLTGLVTSFAYINSPWAYEIGGK